MTGSASSCWIRESEESAAFPRRGGQERERHKSSLCSQESHGVNTVVRGEEELQSGSGVNADGATGHAAQSKQNKLG